MNRIVSKRIESLKFYVKIIKLSDAIQKKIMIYLLYFPNATLAILFIALITLLGNPGAGSANVQGGGVIDEFSKNIIPIFSVVTAVAALLANIAWNFAKLPGINEDVDRPIDTEIIDSKDNEKLFVDSAKWFVIAILLLLPSLMTLYIIISLNLNLQIVEAVKTFVYTALIGALWSVIFGLNKIVSYFSKYVDHYFEKSTLSPEVWEDVIEKHARFKYQSFTWSLIYITTLFAFLNPLISILASNFMDIYFSFLLLFLFTMLPRLNIFGAKKINLLVYPICLLIIFFFSERVIDLII